MWTKSIVLWCDEEGCDDWHMPLYLDHMDEDGISKIRFDARIYGWRFVEGKDYCRIHAKEFERVER